MSIKQHGDVNQVVLAPMVKKKLLELLPSSHQYSPDIPSDTVSAFEDRIKKLEEKLEKEKGKNSNQRISIFGSLSGSLSMESGG